MPDGGELHTIELDDELEDFITERFRRSPNVDKLHLHIGDVAEVVPELGGSWDMVFMDANKRHYVDYYNMLLPLVNSGGYILADNTLWDGKVTDGEAHHDAQTRGIMAFNDLVAADPRVERVILPLRDGLTLIRKL